MKKYAVLLYYCYSNIEDTATYRDEHHQLCVNNNLLGRIIIASEGLNGTVSGLVADCETYMSWVKADERFKNIDFKIDYSDEHTFQKMHVRVKNEIVHSDLGVNPLVRTGQHLEPAELKKLLATDPEVVMVDMRSNYEHIVGKFKNAVTFDMENLRDLPDHIHEIEHLKNKKIVTYCTGGIKCEKASAYLLENGFENVYQLHGGIIKYGLEEGGEDFDGKCYVFDNRLTVEVNAVNPTVISTCHICHTPSDRMINCANPTCNDHIPVCENCGWDMDGCCSEACKNVLDKREYTGAGYYPKKTEHYTPLQGLKSFRNTKTEN
jgi:UPF0176 protein